MPDSTAPTVATEHLDVLIIGAGISGIGIAYHLQKRHPSKSYTILEARNGIGGTWDLFRYPGIRSDSDLFTFGYSFNPWLEDRSIADAPSILRYVKTTASNNRIDEKVRLGYKVGSASWSSAEQLWTVEAEDMATGKLRQYTARWIFSACGYYRYDQGYTPHFDGINRFGGTIVHPQHWPEDLDFAGKRVVVIGSGATAVTIIPAIADQVAHVTMLQRTPTYIIAAPAVNPVDAKLRQWFGAERGSRMAREFHVRIGDIVFKFSRKYPERMRNLIRKSNVKSLGEGFDVDKHLTPPYNPWDQRICVAPDGDLFEAINAGKASIVTDTVATFTEDGIRLGSGEELEADIIVTATGLQMLPFGGISLSVDGEVVSFPDTVVYKGLMLSDVPNFGYVFGYTNASWTLRVDLVADHFCRILALMDEHGYGQCVPERPGPGSTVRPLLENFSAGYVQRSLDQFPRQGTGAPWELPMDFIRDRKRFREGPVGDHLRFTTSPHVDRPPPTPVEVAA